MSGELVKTRLVAVVVLAGVVPWLVTLAASAAFGDGQHVHERLHEAIELAGAAIALGVAALLLLRARHEPLEAHLLWVAAALVAMGLVDAVHAIAPVGVAWSWLRHGATLVGGALFGLVWLTPPAAARRAAPQFVLAAGLLALLAALGVWQAPGALPAPWGPDGYTTSVKLANVVGGLGFLAAALFFSARWLREPRADHLVFASHTLLFAAASLLFGFSHRWALDWWLWHAFRLLAYVVVIVAAYELVAALYQRSGRHAEQLGHAIDALQLEIAERARTEQELERHRHDLEGLVDERTEALREADRRKNEFMAVLSHELRNPLAPIRNSLYVLDRVDPRGEQARRAKAVMGRQVDQLARLTDDLLDVTRVTRNKIVLQRERLDLVELVRRAAEDQRSVFEQHGVRLELQLDPGPLAVEADRARLAQVVSNLLQNAAKFTGTGGLTRVVLEQDGAAQAVLRLRDTGIGMDRRTLEGLFQPFVQADASLDRSQGGLGLGLALVKGLVELHGGSVTAHSEGLGRGAEFVVRLPLAPAVAEGPPARAPALAPGRRRVLVIEDNPDGAESLCELLELNGHEVRVAHDGPQGLAEAQRFRPDVVLCDVGLPGMDGYAVARAFRAEPELAGARLVAVTGYALPEDLQRANEAGFDGHIAKPPAVEAIERVLRPDAPRQPAHEPSQR